MNVLGVNATVMFTKDVRVIDISVDGVSLESNKLINIGNCYSLRLSDKEKSVSLRGKVVWSSLIESRKAPSGDVMPVYKVGMNFVDRSTEQVIEFLHFIDSKSFAVMPDGMTIRL